jgi:hypothetical protein
LIEPFYTIRSWISWIIANTFGRRILYPGSLTILHMLAQDQLLEGRTKLLERVKKYNFRKSINYFNLGWSKKYFIN